MRLTCHTCGSSKSKSAIKLIKYFIINEVVDFFYLCIFVFLIYDRNHNLNSHIYILGILEIESIPL
jgi:hypothetical protein